MYIQVNKYVYSNWNAVHKPPLFEMVKIAALNREISMGARG